MVIDPTELIAKIEALIQAHVIAAAKLRSRRLARGTVGPKKKLEIHGTVPATISLPTAPVATTSHAVAAPAAPHADTNGAGAQAVAVNAKP